ncbi:Oligomycin resistance ATP-dependent permease YOR1-like protein 2, partial [Colletotrichum chlorophyti]
LVATIVQAITPLLLKYIIAFAAESYDARHSGRKSPAVSYGIGLVIAVTALQIIMTLSSSHFLYQGLTIGGEAHAVLMSQIFAKSLKLSDRAKVGGAFPSSPSTVGVKGGQEEIVSQKDGNEGWSNGRIINLLSTDTSRIDQASSFFHLLWSAPLSIIITIVLLIVNLGYSALPGLGVLFLSMILLGKAAHSLLGRRTTINKLTDSRLSLTSEMLQSIRFIKLFAWESSFLRRIENIRKDEIESVQVLQATRDAIQSIGVVFPVFASMLSFIAYALTRHQLSPAPVFASLALFNQIRFPLSIFPVALGQVIDAHASVKRIQEFLLSEEATEEFDHDYDNKHAIKIENATFRWEQARQQQTGVPSEKAETPETPATQDAFQISDLNLAIDRSELVGLIGTVSSGKSSLLAALAGDMRKTTGRVTFGASRAFCPQEAWIRNTSVRENITFGKSFDREWYNKVIQACALHPDFEMLPEGDMTEIGERGITVSGGQKQRISIARAIYFDADIILMDDPLSAVDADVGRKIMDEAICGLLANKCRVLATHSLHVLNRCDKIVWLEKGRIKAEGTYQQLMEKENDFVQLMNLTSNIEDEPGKATGSSAAADGNDISCCTTSDLDRMESKRSPMVKVDLMQDEERAIKAVAWDVYRGYLKAAGSLLVAPLVIFLLALSQAAYILTGLWLSWWTAGRFSLTMGGWLILRLQIGIYAGLGVGQTLMLFAFSVSISLFGTRASRRMFRNAMSRVLRAPISFFDTTPLGRIANRFSKDVDVMDNKLTDSLTMYLMTIGTIIATFALIIGHFYLFVAALVPLVIIYVCIASYYRSSAREVKRLAALQRSVVISRVSEAVYGTSTIRAYGMQDEIIGTVRQYIDDFDGVYFLTFVNQCWLGLRLDAIGLLMVFIIGILIVTSRFSVHPSIGGLVLSYMLSIVNICNYGVRQMAEVENDMNSAERLHYYGTALEEEVQLDDKHTEISPTWPQVGEISFDQVELRYRPGLPLVLKGLDIQVRGGERLGIVGRTGSGKTTILQALFRMAEISNGSIAIDGVDIRKISVTDLRSRLAIIPQDPTLFKGTVRSNLDPFNKHSDLELASALQRSGLADGTGNCDVRLDTLVEEEGLNFSLGQRQLMALARALVKDSKIIVCDEGTSSVDSATDQRVQRTLEGARDKTFLCVAHRLRTVIRYDRICVIDNGHVAELDSPLHLYDHGGIFKVMCDKSGIRREDILEELQIPAAV